ncbi:hypothetical protein [Clostridium thailandense]|nr:hypothetical protein [Clostridium thailandense]
MKYPDGHISASEYAEEIHIGNNAVILDINYTLVMLDGAVTLKCNSSNV